MKKMKLTRSLMAAVSIVALSAVMYGCVHDGGSDTTTDDTDMDMMPEPTAYETAKTAIMAAETAEAAQAAYDEVDQSAITGAQAASLMAALNSRKMALATMAREASQKTALMTAAGMIDTSDLSTQELVNAARTAIAGLRQALDDAADVSEADKAIYMTQLNNAVGAVDDAQGGLDTATRRTNQMAALTSASGTLQTALAALSGSTPTQAQLDDANDALTALNGALGDAADLTETEKAPYEREATNAAAPINMAQSAFDDADEKAEDTANAAMAVTAAKLYTGISAPMGDVTSPANTDRAAAYNTAGTAVLVTIGDGTNTPTPITLSEDKMTMVADNHDWEGKRYADPAGGDMVEAMVYSNVGAPKPGRKFGSTAAVTETGAYEYQLNADGELAAASITAANVVLTGVTRTAGTEAFSFPDPDDTTPARIRIPGSYHGVPGNYYCTPSTRANGCSAAVAAEGFTLSSGDTWVFAPSNAESRVMDAADTAYASYGWWLRKAANDGPFTASAFHDFKGTAGTVDITNLVAGTATYVGGAAGKYALASSTGGTNDAGHFTARATLEAEFGDATAGNTITGTIDMFRGADGEVRNWSVKLNETTVGDNGVIAPLTTTATAAATVWTIGAGDDAVAAAGSGEWSGNLREEGDDGVPQVATGTFYTEYNRAGKMVGAFGANE